MDGTPCGGASVSLTPELRVTESRSPDPHNMGDSLELIGKRLFLLLSDGGTGAPQKAAGPCREDWLRGTVRAVSVIGLAAPPEAGGGEAAAGLTVSVYIHVLGVESGKGWMCGGLLTQGGSWVEVEVEAVPPRCGAWITPPGGERESLGWVCGGVARW